MRKGLADSIIALLRASPTGAEFFAKMADLIRQSRNYRWVGIYEVGPEEVSIVAYSGPDAPAYPKFPITKGLTGSAIGEKRTVVVGDVRNDPRYLTAFGSTLSEIVIPVLDEKTGRVVGTIDVESENADAFSSEDQSTLEECARAAASRWVNKRSK
jgi:putative methionine-R-sulfoxide reductase with GAF domain